MKFYWLPLLTVSFLATAGTDELVFVSDFELREQLLFAELGATGDEFGRSVGISGSLVAVGARRDSTQGANSGAVYVFEQELDGVWCESEKLSPSDGGSGKRFGRSVGVSGERIAVSAADLNRPGNLGTAYVFERTIDGMWEEKALVFASDTQIAGAFGVSIAISGDYLAVGDNLVNSSTGSITMFERNQQGQWLEVDTLRASNGESNDGFGFSLAMDGDSLIAGGASFIQAAESAYVFERQNDGTWKEVSVLTANNAEPGDSFGLDVGIYGDYAIVGASGDDDEASSAGAAYVFHRSSAESWTFETKLTASDAGELSLFGEVVEIGAGRILVTAEQDTFVNDFAGAVYVFDQQTDGSWVEVGKRGPVGAETGDAFGFSLAIDRTRALIGAYKDEAPGQPPDSGTAYFFN